MYVGGGRVGVCADAAVKRLSTSPHIPHSFLATTIPQVRMLASSLLGGSRESASAWLRHVCLSLSAVGAFKAEDCRGVMPAPVAEVCHALWHLLAAAAMLSMAPILQQQQQQRMVAEVML